MPLLIAGVALLGAVLTGAPTRAAAEPTGSAPAREVSRIVSTSGTLTEIVFALGAGESLVGVDTSSVFPAAATKLPQVGYQRTLAAEGILSLRPTLVLATDDAGPPAVLEQIGTAGVPVERLSAQFTVKAAIERIRQVARLLGRQSQGEALIAALERDLAAAAADEGAGPRVLFIYARGAGLVNVSGTETAADAMIRLAGGVNAVTGYTGFKPLTSEAAVAAAPKVLLLPARGIESLGGAATLLAMPGISQTPAARQRRLVVMDDLYLLGFGPRLGQAVAELARQLRNAPLGDTSSAAATPE